MALSKTQLMEEMAKETGASKLATKTSRCACIKTITKNMGHHEEINIVGFSKFSIIVEPGKEG